MKIKYLAFTTAVLIVLSLAVVAIGKAVDMGGPVIQHADVVNVTIEGGGEMGMMFGGAPNFDDVRQTQ